MRAEGAGDARAQVRREVLFLARVPLVRGESRGPSAACEACLALFGGPCRSASASVGRYPGGGARTVRPAGRTRGRSGEFARAVRASGRKRCRSRRRRADPYSAGLRPLRPRVRPCCVRATSRAAARRWSPASVCCRTIEMPVLLPFALGSLGCGLSRVRAAGRGRCALLEEAARGVHGDADSEHAFGCPGHSGRGRTSSVGRLADAPDRRSRRRLARAHRSGGWKAWCLKTARRHRSPSRASEAEPAADALPARRSGSRPSWACARSSPTVTSASASSTGAPVSSERRKSISTTATTMFREMDMRFWLEQAQLR